MPTLIGVRRLPRILLVEPDGLVRGTVASVCRDLQLADVVQAGSWMLPSSVTRRVPSWFTRKLLRKPGAPAKRYCATARRLMRGTFKAR